MARAAVARSTNVLPSFQRLAASRPAGVDLTRPDRTRGASTAIAGMWPPSGSEPPSSDDERDDEEEVVVRADPDNPEDDEAAEAEAAEAERGRRAAPPPPPLQLSWLDLSVVGYPRSVALSELPGAAPGRRLADDLDRLVALGVTAVLLLCTPAELVKHGVPQLVEQYAAHGMVVCQRAILEGEVPETSALLRLFAAAERALEAGGRVLLHCTTGLGRTCTVAACLLLHVDEALNPDQAVEVVRQLRGSRAVQSVRQFNFIQEYREERDQLVAEMALPESRPVSR